MVEGEVPLDYFGDLETEYEKRNKDYMGGAHYEERMESVCDSMQCHPTFV